MVWQVMHEFKPSGKSDILDLQTLDELGFNERNDRYDTALPEKAPCTQHVDHEEAHHTLAGVTPKNKIYGVSNIPFITVVAEYHRKIYQSGQLPSKKYRVLPWGLSTTVACTRVADYHKKMPFMTIWGRVPR